MHLRSVIIAATLGFGMATTTPTITLADQHGAFDLGEEAYMTFCATCHGPLAEGNGPLSEMITDKIADLTQLSINNHGEFPMLRVIHIIDGRTGLRGHGGPMPVYGQLFKDSVGGPVDTFEAELAARGRMLSLALYLESIQK